VRIRTYIFDHRSPVAPGREGVASSRIAFHVSRFTRHAFSLIEILVVVALLSFIILGLVAMFDQTKRAFTQGMTQVDVLESGRAASEMISRELSQMVPAPYLSNVVTFNASIYFWLPPRRNVAPLVQPLPGTDSTPPIQANERTNILEQMFFLTRENRTWEGIGYWIGDPQGRIPAEDGWGTLYRYFRTNTFGQHPSSLYSNFFRADARTNQSTRIVDGVVHFKVRAYDPRGVWITNSLALKGNSEVRDLLNSRITPGEIEFYRFTNNAVPAFVEFELGILEERTLARVKSIPDRTARRKYLRDQAGRVHIFRTRVPVRNVDPSAYQ